VDLIPTRYGLARRSDPLIGPKVRYLRFVSNSPSISSSSWYGEEAGQKSRASSGSRRRPNSPSGGATQEGVGSTARWQTPTFSSLAHTRPSMKFLRGRAETTTGRPPCPTTGCRIPGANLVHVANHQRRLAGQTRRGGDQPPARRTVTTLHFASTEVVSRPSDARVEPRE